MATGRPISSLLLFGAGLWACGSCTTTAVVNLPAAQSDFVGPIGQVATRAVQVGFVNNTPFRAIFTFGSYNPLDQEGLPTNFGQRRIEGNTATAVVAAPCRKTFSIGGEELIRLIDQNRNNPQIVINDERALVEGVFFSSAPLGDPLEAEPTEGTAQAINLLNGVDFSCVRKDIFETTGAGLLTFTFEEDPASPGGFRIDYAFLPP
ncbi:hypothetical protein RAS2_01510 [Phycisphaerae bacterium RAS2]|nr:hypothetical protein RAS2_01510 [Phycisphaerae bacterium RAS2]